jgi:hypothetical protein
MFTNYSYQRVRVTELAQAYQDAALLRRNPFLYDSLLIGQNGERIISKITPASSTTPVDQPIFPTSGKRLSASIDLAGLGGNTQFYKPQMEGIYIWKQNNTVLDGDARAGGVINPIGRTNRLPIFEKLFLGGEYSVRGFDIRSIGPTIPTRAWSWAATRACCSTSSRTSTSPGRCGDSSSWTRARSARQGEGFGWTQQVIQVNPAASSTRCCSIRSRRSADRPERAARTDHNRGTEGVQDVDRRRGTVFMPVLKRAVPVDLRLQPRAAKAFWIHPHCGRRMRSSSGSRWEPRSDPGQI